MEDQPDTRSQPPYPPLSPYHPSLYQCYVIALSLPLYLYLMLFCSYEYALGYMASDVSLLYHFSPAPLRLGSCIAVYSPAVFLTI